MPDWVIWMIASAVLMAIELLTVALVAAGMAVAAAAAGIAAALDAKQEVQFIVFIVMALATIVGVRPIAARHLLGASSNETRSGTARLIGSTALVLEPVSAHAGLVKIGGESWTARTEGESDVIEPGQSVNVVRIDGATAIVA